MKCEADVPYKLNFYRTRKCHREATVTVDGKHYCTIHSPEATASRALKKEEHFKQKLKLDMAMYIAHLQTKKKK
jgi:hypothetical protein